MKCPSVSTVAAYAEDDFVGHEVRNESGRTRRCVSVAISLCQFSLLREIRFEVGVKILANPDGHFIAVQPYGDRSGFRMLRGNSHDQAVGEFFVVSQIG